MAGIEGHGWRYEIGAKERRVKSMGMNNWLLFRVTLLSFYSLFLGISSYLLSSNALGLRNLIFYFLFLGLVYFS